MLTAILIVKLIAEIALLSLVGQWILGLLAGAKREQNFFYKTLGVVGRPFVAGARYITPKFVLERHLPLVAVILLTFIWAGATVLKVQTCLQIGVEYCK